MTYKRSTAIIIAGFTIASALIPPGVSLAVTAGGAAKKNAAKKQVSRNLTRREFSQSVLSAGSYFRQKGNYRKAKDAYEGAVLVAQTWRNEQLTCARSSSNQISRIQKLIQVDGSRPDWEKKLASAKSTIAAVRSMNLDLWLIQLRGYLSAGEMADVLGERDEVYRLYGLALGVTVMLKNQDISDLSAEQLADFEKWRPYPEAKLQRLGVDPAEVVKTAVENAQQDGTEPIDGIKLPFL